MSDTSNFEEGHFHGKVIGELEALKVGQATLESRITGLHTSLDQFKLGLGERVEKHGESIVEIRAHQGVMAKIMWLIGTVAITALMGAILKLVIR
jgi:hypothetical protein